MKLIGNGHARELVYGWDLPEGVLTDFDYCSESSQFFQYRGEWYPLADFTSTTSSWCSYPKDHPFMAFDGYLSDTTFSAVLIKFDREEMDERVKVYLALS